MLEKSLGISKSNLPGTLKTEKGYSQLTPISKTLVCKQVLNVGRIIDADIDHESKVDSLIESAGLLDSLRNWKATDKNHENNGRVWKKQMSEENKDIFENLNTICASKICM